MENNLTDKQIRRKKEYEKYKLKIKQYYQDKKEKYNLYSQEYYEKHKEDIKTIQNYYKKGSESIDPKQRSINDLTLQLDNRKMRKILRESVFDGQNPNLNLNRVKQMYLLQKRLKEKLISSSFVPLTSGLSKT